MSLVFYHGTYHDYEKMKLPQGDRILWLTPNPVVAREYASPYYSKGPAYVWEIRLKSGSKIINLRDLDHPVVRKAFDALNEAYGSTSFAGVWTEDYWRKNVDFGVLEHRRWLPGFFRRNRIDGLVIQDKLGTTPINHESVALLRKSAIQSMERKVVEKGKAQTIGEIEQEAQEWDRAHGRMAQRVVARHLQTVE